MNSSGRFAKMNFMPRLSARVQARGRALTGLALASLLLAGAALWLASGAGSALAASPGSGPSPAQEVTSQGEAIRHAVAELADGKARHFAYKTPEGVTVRYFLVQDGRGKVRAALDACEVCWRAGLGYEQEGDFMVCRNCGRRFATVQVGDERGGCNPVPLHLKIEQGQALVKAQELADGRGYFELPSRRRERRP